MHKIEKLGLQVFAAPDNMTGQEQIQVKAREIDFVTSFGKNIQALLDVLGIIRMIKKDNNTVLNTKKGDRKPASPVRSQRAKRSRTPSTLWKKFRLILLKSASIVRE